MFTQTQRMIITTSTVKIKMSSYRYGCLARRIQVRVVHKLSFIFCTAEQINLFAVSGPNFLIARPQNLLLLESNRAEVSGFSKISLIYLLLPLISLLLFFLLLLFVGKVVDRFVPEDIYVKSCK